MNIKKVNYSKPNYYYLWVPYKNYLLHNNIYSRSFTITVLKDMFHLIF